MHIESQSPLGLHCKHLFCDTDRGFSSWQLEAFRACKLLKLEVMRSPARTIPSISSSDRLCPCFHSASVFRLRHWHAANNTVAHLIRQIILTSLIVRQSHYRLNHQI